MKADSNMYRLILVSPWSLCIFLLIPLLVILSVSLHIRLPFLGSTTPLIVNNIFFAFIAACRLLRYSAGMRSPLRYGATHGKPRRSVMYPMPVADARAQLVVAGFLFDTQGGYAEKHDRGYYGTTILYGGLFILLSVGSWDNLQQFSGVLLDGIGMTTNLNSVKTYRTISKGPMAPIPASLPKMQIINQLLPDTINPKGATEVAFILPDGKAERVILKPSDPVSYGAYDVYMAKLVFEPQIVIKTKDSQILFDDFVKLDPLVQKRGVYSFYGLFHGDILGGGVYYQPEKSTLMVVISRGDKKVVSDMTFQTDQQVEQGDYILSCSKMGQWSEIHVVHRRHKVLLVVSAVIAFIGLLLRMALRPQRVWLEEAAEGCRTWSVGKEAEKLLKAES